MRTPTVRGPLTARFGAHVYVFSNNMFSVCRNIGAERSGNGAIHATAKVLNLTLSALGITFFFSLFLTSSCFNPNHRMPATVKATRFVASLRRTVRETIREGGIYVHARTHARTYAHTRTTRGDFLRP